MEGVIMSRMSYLVSIFFLCIVFNSCDSGEVEFAAIESSVESHGDTTNGSTPVGDPGGSVDLEVVVSSCADLQVIEQTVKVNFPDPQVTCKWGENGNLEKRDKFLQARIEQNFDLSIPENAVICGLNFYVSDQPYRYDDHFLMTFDDSVMASSYDFGYLLSSEGGILQYDWAKIAGEVWDNSNEGVFCLGAETDGSTCAFPATDTQGVIDLNFNTGLIQKVMALNLGRSSHKLSFITIGDNDEWDCEHSDISFDVDISYVINQ